MSYVNKPTPKPRLQVAKKLPMRHCILMKIHIIAKRKHTEKTPNHELMNGTSNYVAKVN